MIKERSNGFVEYALAFLFVLPYAETSIIADTLRYTTNDTYWKAILSIELMLLVLLFPTALIKTKNINPRIKQIKNIITPFIVTFFALLVYTFLLNGFALSALNLFLMVTVPLINAYLVHKFIANKGLKVKTLIRKSVFLFVSFVVFSIIFNILKYGFSINFAEEKTRLTASAGGPVIFGYTMSVVFAFIISHKECFRTSELTAALSILLFGILLTQDRGALIVVALCALYVMKHLSRKMFWGVLTIMVLFLVPLFLNEMENSVFFSRITKFDMSSDDRLYTLSAALSTYFDEIKFVFFGHGLDGFFPYQHWLLNTSQEEVYNNVDFNVMQYNGRYMLVQPHNTFVYFLMETGVVGLFAFCRMLYGFYKKTIPNNRGPILIVLTSLICISMLESAVILEPGIACTLWLIVLYSFIYTENPQSKRL